MGAGHADAAEQDGAACPGSLVATAASDAMEGDRQRCLDADMDGYVSKPIDATQLFAVIDDVSKAA